MWNKGSKLMENRRGISTNYVALSSNLAQFCNSNGIGNNYALAFEKSFGKQFSIKTDIGRESKNLVDDYVYNETYQDYELGSGLKTDIKFSYISIPILGSLAFGQNRTCTLILAPCYRPFQNKT